VFVFHLAEAGRVRVTFREVRCGGTASLTVRGHRGLNRVRFTGRIRRHRLAPGTYRIRVRSQGRTLLRKTLVVGDGLASCTLERELDAVLFAGATLFKGTPGAHSDADAARAAAPAALTPRPRHEGVLGAAAARVLPDSRGARIALLAMLTLGILLLGLGALPERMVPDTAAAAFLARERVIFAACGLAVMTGVGLAYLMG
jgi:hypothetical protein